MVCIAAFIILCIMSLFVGIVAIFKRDVGRRYWKTFKKAWGCVWKKVRFQKCETNFKDDVKNSLLSKVVVKKPKLVKPLSIGIEVTSVLIVLVAIWSIVVLIKGGLALIAFGNCDVQHPENCFTGSQVCSEASKAPENPIEAVGQWFGDFGIIGEGLWSKFKTWDATALTPDYVQYYNDYDASKPTALDIFDPGCQNCLQTFINQRDSGFLDNYNVAIMPYVLGDGEGNDKFNNSTLISKYIVAAYLMPLNGSDRPTAWRLIENLFTIYTEDNQIYQSAFSSATTTPEFVEDTLRTWLADFGYSTTDIATFTALAHSDKVATALEDFRTVAIEEIHIDVPVVGVPTQIYDNSRHSGTFQQ